MGPPLWVGLKLMHSYLSGRKERTKIGNSYSPWEDITHGFPQGSILGPLLFNIFLCDMFFILHDIEIASYADDTTPYVSANSIEETISILEDISEKLFQWFTSNQMKANEEKCNLLLSKNSSVSIKIKDTKVKNSACEKASRYKHITNSTLARHGSDIAKSTIRT